MPGNVGIAVGKSFPVHVIGEMSESVFLAPNFTPSNEFLNVIPRRDGAERCFREARVSKDFRA